jgi:hypothetical protein
LDTDLDTDLVLVLDLVFCRVLHGTRKLGSSDRIGSGLSLFPCMMHPSPIQHRLSKNKNEDENENEDEDEDDENATLGPLW